MPAARCIGGLADTFESRRSELSLTLAMRSRTPETNTPIAIAPKTNVMGPVGCARRPEGCADHSIISGTRKARNAPYARPMIA